MIPPILVHIGCDATQRSVGSVIVVVVDPVFQDQSGFTHGSKLPLIQAVISEYSVEALVIAILPGLARFYVLSLYSLFSEHFLNRPGDEFAPIVTAYPIRLTIDGEKPL